jgi:hypothetical protein
LNRLAIHFELHGHFLPQPPRQRHFTFIPLPIGFRRRQAALADKTARQVRSSQRLPKWCGSFSNADLLRKQYKPSNQSKPALSLT